jgi:hypothetical protein
MRLSISNSNARLPKGNLLRSFAVAVLIAIVAIVGWEWFIRVKGFEAAAVIDSRELWAQQRQRASWLGKDAVILVGSSRMQLGVNLGVLAKHTKTHPIQLAIYGQTFWPVLEDLAADDSITGTVIVDMSISQMEPFLDSDFRPDQKRNAVVREWIEYYHSHGFGRSQPYYRPLETKLRDGINRMFAFRSSGVSPQYALFGNRETMAYEVHLKMAPDRSIAADYQKVDLRRLKSSLIARDKMRFPVAFIDIPDFTQRLSSLKTLVSKIQSRGGRVILVYLPTQGEIARIDEVRFPKAIYWDRLAKATGAETIHYKDYPALLNGDLPDGVHLDYRQTGQFTDALGRIVFLRGVSD